MFISSKQVIKVVGQVAATLGVGIATRDLAKALATQIYENYYHWKYGPEKNNPAHQKTFEAAQQIANKVLNVASAIVGLIAGAFTANYIELVSLSSLASRFSIF